MSAITVHDSSLPLVEYQGRRVVTFAMIDEVHQRPEGTASAAFRRNRDRFTIGKHYFVLDADAIRNDLKVTANVKRTQSGEKVTADAKRRQSGEKVTASVKETQSGEKANSSIQDWHSPADLFPKHTQSGVVVTEFGYLLLVKPFKDDLSWQIQERLVEAYFRTPNALYGISPVPIPSLEELETMPLQQAANLLAMADKTSSNRHGQPGSAGMTQRRRELKVLRPAFARIQQLIQLTIPGLEETK